MVRSAKVGAVAGLMAMVLWAQPSWAADRAFAIITGFNLGLIEGDSTFSLAPKSIEVFNTGFGLAVAPGGFSKPVACPLTMLKRFEEMHRCAWLCPYSGGNDGCNFRDEKRRVRQ